MSDLSDTRLAAAKELGADVAINPKRDDAAAVLSELTDGVLADVTIEAVGVQATANQSILCLRVGGKAIWVGMSQKEMTINMQDIVCSARQVIGSFNYTHEEFGEVVQLLGQRRYGGPTAHFQGRLSGRGAPGLCGPARAAGQPAEDHHRPHKVRRETA